MSEGALLLAFRVSEITAGLISGSWRVRRAGRVATLLGARTLRQWRCGHQGTDGVVPGSRWCSARAVGACGLRWWALLTGLLELLEGPAASGAVRWGGRR